MTQLFKIGQEVQANDTHLIEYLLQRNLTTKGIVVSIIQSSSAFKRVPVVYQVKFGGATYTVGVEEHNLVAVINTFNSQAEVWQYLLSGGIVVLVGGINIYAIENNKVVCLNRRDLEITADFSNYLEFTKYTEPAKWYDNIPKDGRLCWVYDREDQIEDKITEIITKYIPSDIEPFLAIDGKTSWMYATPVTQEEVNKLICQQ